PRSPLRALRSDVADFFERLECPASVSLRFLALNSVPLARVLGARHYKSRSRAQRIQRSTSPASVQIGPAPHAKDLALQRTRPSGETKSPVLCSRGTSHLGGGGKLDERTVLPGLQQFGRAAKDGANLISRENSHSCP